MYSMRFGGEDVSGLTMQQLRGREGVRVRKTYLAEAKRTQVKWERRDYKVEDFASSDAVNQALSAANTALYGVAHSVIVALGCSPALGFVHHGNVRSFVYDVADLYKAEITIPMAFDIAASGPPDVGVAARRGVRDLMRGGKFMQRCAQDIRHLLLPDDPVDEQDIEFDDLSDGVLHLWGGSSEDVAAGQNYGGMTGK
jgi:CRISPR-associated protein Cas1